MALYLTGKFDSVNKPFDDVKSTGPVWAKTKKIMPNY
jgi:hypothetical protein